jgi:cytochrome c peroxidase
MILWLALACGPRGETAVVAPSTWSLPLPYGFPEPPVPDSNPATPEKFELGRHLFFDERLSANETQACSGCHDPALAFADGLTTSTGSEGAVLSRNSMALVNVAWNSTYTWPNPTLVTLEEQLLVPMFGESPVELGWTGHEAEILARIDDDPQYDELFADAFPGEDVSVETVVAALATFVRGLTSADSPYDRYLAGEPLDPAAERGLILFFSEKAECYHCHSGPTFSVAFASKDRPDPGNAFFNTGLYNVDGQGAYPPNNQGLIEFTDQDYDMGRFRAPTLRNLRWTAPYFHDGSGATLDDVIDHYDVGGRTVEGDYAGVGAESPLKDPLVRPMNLTDSERADLLAFLDALNDPSFVEQPAFTDPWAGP